MMPNFLIAFGAGATSALLFASVASGSLLAILLFYLAPLPILIAALAWTHWTALAAALLAAAGLGVAIDPFFFLSFLVGIGLPSWWLGYLALLARPAGPSPADGLEWYPVGRLLIWAALLGGLVIGGMVLSISTDEEEYRQKLRSVFEQALRSSRQGPAPTAEDSERVLDLFVTMAPLGAAVFTGIINAVNLWLAARVVHVSGRLRRPWPDITALQLPRGAAALLALGCLGMVLFDGMIGVVAGILAFSMVMAYAALGFAVLHTITRGTAGRSIILAGTYAVVLLLSMPLMGVPGLAMALLGLADSVVDLRSRFAGKPGPPADPT